MQKALHPSFPDMPMFEDPTTHSTFVKKPDESLAHAIARSQMSFSQYPKRTSLKTFAAIEEEYQQKYGANHHHLRLVCALCHNTLTCRCSNPKITEKGICKECASKNPPEVHMPAKEFFDEHKHLIPTLEHGSQEARNEEAQEQTEEVQSWREKLKRKASFDQGDISPADLPEFYNLFSRERRQYLRLRDQGLSHSDALNKAKETKEKSRNPEIGKKRETSLSKTSWEMIPQLDSLEKRKILQTNRIDHAKLEEYYKVNISNWVDVTVDVPGFGPTRAILGPDVFRYLVSIQEGDDVANYSIDYAEIVGNGGNPYDFKDVIKEALIAGAEDTVENTTLDELAEDEEIIKISSRKATLNPPEKPAIASSNSPALGIDTQRTPEGKGEVKDASCNENPIHSWVIRKEGNSSLIGKECKTHAGIFLEANGKPLESVKLEKGDKNLSWRELISEAEWISKFEDMLVKKSWETPSAKIEEQKPLPRDRTPFVYNSEFSSEIDGDSNTPRMGYISHNGLNWIRAGVFVYEGQPRAEITDDEDGEIYLLASFSTIEEAAQYLSQIIKVPVDLTKASSLDSLYKATYVVGTPDHNCTLCKYFAPHDLGPSMTGKTPEDLKTGICSYHRQTVIGNMVCNDFKRVTV